MRVVHVRVRRAAFADTLGEMRQWLDRHNRPLVRFETEGDSDSIIIKTQFDTDDLAELFRKIFRVRTTTKREPRSRGGVETALPRSYASPAGPMSR